MSLLLSLSLSLALSLSSLSLLLSSALTQAGARSTFAVFQHYIIPHGTLLNFWQLLGRYSAGLPICHGVELRCCAEQINHALTRPRAGSKVREMTHAKSFFFPRTRRRHHDWSSDPVLFMSTRGRACPTRGTASVHLSLI